MAVRRRERHSFNSDVRLCAIEIFCDLCRYGIPRSLYALHLLCERHGRRLAFDASLAYKAGGKCVGKRIVVSLALDYWQFYEVIPHELVHALSESSRWEWLNRCIAGWRYDRDVFVEAVARMVGKMFAHQLTA